LSQIASTENTSQLRDKTIAVLGAGKMGSLILRALLESGLVDRSRLRGSVKHNEHARELRESMQISIGTSNLEAARDADVVILCVKPSGIAKVAEAIRQVVSSKVLVISIATGVTTEGIESVLGPGVPVIRAMPNTPCQIGRGMTALCAGKCCQEPHIAVAEAIFSRMGKTAQVDEIHMDAVTGLSASGPAFIYIVLEALAEGGVRVGLSRETATLFAANAALGAASMVLSTGAHPAVLKDEVTTPGGCTIDGILELEEGNIRATLIKAITTTTRKASQLARS
jgi:pyrroline-5-carboxylate reductase